MTYTTNYGIVSLGGIDMRIAVDNHVGHNAIRHINNQGHKVVFKAQNQLDRVWFESALDYGADLVVSMDWDIAFLCNRHNVKFIQLGQGIGGVDAAKFVLDRINKGQFD